MFSLQVASLLDCAVLKARASSHIFPTYYDQQRSRDQTNMPADRATKWKTTIVKDRFLGISDFDRRG